MTDMRSGGNWHMTDIACWHLLIDKKRIPRHTALHCHDGGNGSEEYYVRVPLNKYQIGNLLGLLKRTKNVENGDWYREILDILHRAMEKLEIEGVSSNFGDVFRTKDVRHWLEQEDES